MRAPTLGQAGSPGSRFATLSLIVAFPLWLPMPVAFAQELERATIAPSGETSSGGSFEIVSLAGQPLVGRAEGGAFVLEVGGLRPRPDAIGSLIFTDGFESAARRRSEKSEEEPE